jgi:hypothetical protein
MQLHSTLSNASTNNTKNCFRAKVGSKERNKKKNVKI